MAIRNIARKIKRAISKPFDIVEGKLKKVDEARRARNLKMINENWGSVEEYHKRRGK